RMNPQQRQFARIAPMRAKVVFFGLLAVGLFLSWRLFDVQVLRGPVLAKEALAQRSDAIDIFARRGSIVDRDGNVLVRSLPSESVYVVPHDLADPDAAVAALGKIFGKLDPATVEAMHDKRMWFVWIARKVPYEQGQKVRALGIAAVQLKGEDTGKRVDTVGQLASTVLGFVGTDENGLDGLEYTFDSLLKGTPGKELLETDNLGRPIPLGHDTIVKPARQGLTLQLTLDSYLQFVTEQALETQVREFRAASGTAIVMDPYSGEVLALANAPDFDPNRFWTFADARRRDRAVMDAYEPGSTFKLVTAAAGLESGRVTTGMTFPARDQLEVGGHIIHNAEDGFMGLAGGSESLEQIIALSHNVGAAEVGMHVGARAFYAMEHAAGFGTPTQIGLPGENPGIVPDPKDWSDLSLATMSFGQGVSVTPIAMARFYCAIANGGLLVRPRILRAIENSDGDVVYQYRTEVERRVFSEHTAETLRSFLRAVVLHGTGATARIPGYTTAGKTGTAQMVGNYGYESGAYVASFIGMVPYEHPKYVIYVKLERPEGSIYGGVVAAPAFAKIARQAMLHAGTLPAPPTRANSR
ncbi:MAG: penicillin-binding protein 2, partial [Candidatus Eremiobacteraeota bacterium]|nr:penicillin-binding protein 2 [Candidatus Eremiobacteraeota bacterium]